LNRQVDFSQAAAGLGIETAELIMGLRGDDSTLTLSGTISDRGSNVNFKLRDADAEPLVALLSCASRKGALDSAETPKALIQIRGKSVIRHVLLQLFKGGVDTAYVVIGYLGSLVRADVQSCRDLTHMSIQFIDLGSEYNEGYARSLMYASRRLPGSVETLLLSTADHIFETSIIQSMTKALSDTNVCRVLVEEDPDDPAKLPATCVKTKRVGDKVVALATDLHDFTGIEAGLFFLRAPVLHYFEEVGRAGYFTVAQVLGTFAANNMLEAHLVASRVWIGLETPDAVLTVPDFDFSNNTRVLTGRSASFSNLAALGTQAAATNLVLGFSTSELTEVEVVEDHQKRVAPHSRCRVGGFVIGVGTNIAQDIDPREGSHPSSPPIDGMRREIHSDFVLAPDQQEASLVVAQEATITKMISSDRRSVSNDEAFMVSIPTVPGAEADQMDGSLGYLITLPPGGEASHMLAIPAAIGEEQGQPQLSPFIRPFMNSLSKLSETAKLPSDVTKATVQYTVEKEQGVLQVHVSRSTPWIGFVVLGWAWFAISSSGPAIEEQGDSISFSMKMFWRCTLSIILFGTVALVKCIWLGAKMPTCSLQLLLACVGFSFYTGAYQVAVTMTSVTNATLFGNVPSCFIVLKKALLRQPIALWEGLGALIALGGAMLVAHPWVTAEAGGKGVAPTLQGDLVALIGGAGGAFYLEASKGLRAELDLFVMLSCLFLFQAVAMLSITVFREGSTLTLYDPAATEHSLLGWIYPSGARLYCQLYLSFGVDLCGTMGYIASMKYFDPIVISVVMLAEPIAATAQGVVIGVSDVPDALGIVGAAVVIFGAFLVVKAGSSHEDKVESALSAAGRSESPALNAAAARPLASTKGEARYPRQAVPPV